ncbi:C40 family peptidase [Bailinhaonella thermotolerans]|uniref:C40 family peptidase n=1 Tax=Bailinhaonella thermotolerans TaxID=1070861 RepID=UPI001F5BA0C0|nr:C40 family peptidase [Bailinhaonella thermotolerans]
MRVRRWTPLVVAGTLLANVTLATVSLVAMGEEEPARLAPQTKVAQGSNARFVASSDRVANAAGSVAPFSGVVKPHLFVAGQETLPPDLVDRIRRTKGVARVEVVDAAEVMLSGKRVATLGVDPSTFRAYTPKPTAASDNLWRNVAAGDVAVSFVLGNDGGMTLGSMVRNASRTMRVGAYATMGIGAIDAVVSRDTGRALGLPQGNALLISAPKVDSGKLRKALTPHLPKGAKAVVIDPVLKVPGKVTGGDKKLNGQTWPSSAFMSAEQIRTALTAAGTKLGRPYVWGAEGPDTFDCSGLVQWAFARAGVRMPRVTHQQWVTGPQVPLSQIQPGDLLFWRSDPTNPGYISHVAIYWGDGKMIQAPRTGDVVKIGPIRTRGLAGVVRVSPAIASRVR